jgi:hypothetical protein
MQPDAQSSPSGVEGKRMNDESVAELTVYTAGGQKVIHVPNGRGEELRVHLASHGIESKVSPAAETPYERLEIDDARIDTETLQALADEWER